jgi:hypothetical protein
MQNAKCKMQNTPTATVIIDFMDDNAARRAGIESSNEKG